MGGTQAPLALGVGLGVGLAQARRVLLPGGRPGRWVLATTLGLVAAPLGWLLAAATVAVNDALIPRIPGVVGAVLYLAIVFSGGLLLGMTGAAALPRAAPRVASGGSGY